MERFVTVLIEKTGIDLSADQQVAHDAIVSWFKEGKRPLLTLGGYAGSGKTTLTAAVTATLRAERRNLKIAFVCFTGKASTVLKWKLERVKALQGDYCGTIHGLIYKPKTDAQGRIIGWRRAPDLDADLVILDEASMVDEVVFGDLKSYGKPILAVGDHGQLPPVTGSLNLMANPELRLERIHRQAADNPIIRASMQIRETGHLPFCDWDNKVVKVPIGTAILDSLPNLLETMILCGTNRTRCALNAKIRSMLGYKSAYPEVGERVICLRNNRLKGIFNGMTGVIKKIEPQLDHWYSADIQMDGNGTISERINKRQFGYFATLKGTEIPGLGQREYGELFDWGYALTVHKSQGSEAKQVVVYEECDWLKTEDLRRRWLYTAVTRASERLVVVGR